MRPTCGIFQSCTPLFIEFFSASMKIVHGEEPDRDYMLHSSIHRIFLCIWWLPKHQSEEEEIPLHSSIHRIFLCIYGQRAVINVKVGDGCTPLFIEFFSASKTELTHSPFGGVREKEASLRPPVSLR